MNEGPIGPYRLKLDRAALASNWRQLNEWSGTANTGAAVKADGYGLGARNVVPILLDAGCRDFFVATWEEARTIAPLIGDATLSVLNGVREEDMPRTISLNAKPVLNTSAQVKRWATTGRPCDVMVDSGMNRLGFDMRSFEPESLTQLDIDICMSHLASADEDVSQNDMQRAAYCAAYEKIPHRRTSLANSAGIMLGNDYHFDLTRPGLSLYGGIPRNEMREGLSQVVFPQAQILQKRSIRAGDKIGYNATHVAASEGTIAIVGIGYADGYFRCFSSVGHFSSDGIDLPVIGRVSMDLVALDISKADQLQEGDWVDLPFDLPQLSGQSGMSQYELLTSLGPRAERHWIAP